jgi:hypothetical protein
MLSSLTSFLPSRLQGAKELPRPAVIPDEQSDDEGDDADPSTLPSQPDNKPLKSRDRDGKGPSEVCFSLTCSSFWQAEWIVQTRISRDELDGTSSSYNILLGLLDVDLEQVYSTCRQDYRSVLGWVMSIRHRAR